MWMNSSTLGSSLAFRWSIEQWAGGNGSWNVDVDYRELLERSVDRDEVYALYATAGLDLEADLRALSDAPRISADPTAVNRMQDLVLDGRLQVPVLTLHTIGDGNVIVEAEGAYASTVGAAGQSRLLRQAYVKRAGHVTYTPAEEITALLTLVHRLDIGNWESDDSATLNAHAAMLGPDLNTFPSGAAQASAMPSAFIDFSPAPLLRPFDARCLSGDSVAALIGQLTPVCL
jgi:hypothetical protein